MARTAGRLLRDHGVGLRILNLGIDTGGSGARYDMAKNTA